MVCARVCSCTNGCNIQGAGLPGLVEGGGEAGRIEEQKKSKRTGDLAGFASPSFGLELMILSDHFALDVLSTW